MSNTMFFAMNLSESNRETLQSLTLDCKGEEVKAIEERTRLVKKVEADSSSTKAQLKSAKGLLNNAKANAEAVSLKAYREKTEKLAKEIKMPLAFVRMSYPLYSSAHVTIGKHSTCKNDHYIAIDEIMESIPAIKGKNSKRTTFETIKDELFAMITDRVEKVLAEADLPSKNEVKKKLLELVTCAYPEFTGAVACGMDVDQLEMPLKETVKCEPWMLKEIQQEKFDAQLVRVLYRIVNKMDYERAQPKEQN